MKEILVHPSQLGRNISSVVRSVLRAQVEGKCHGKDGYLIVVSKFNEDIGRGRISPDNGRVSFRVQYEAVLLRPYVGEVVDVEVYNVTQHGFLGRIGPLDHIFVTRYAMPDDILFNRTDRKWESTDGEIDICQGSGVRLKITGITFESNRIKAVGTIKDHYLGLIEKS